MPDQLHGFLFENAPVRGTIAQLEHTWRTVAAHHAYPPAVRSLLGEALAGCAALASTIKFDGSVMLQMQGNGPLTLLVAECTRDLALRATAKWQEGIVPSPLPSLVGDGRCALTLKSADGRQSYQGIVTLCGQTLAHALEHYMASSEQLATRLWLTCSAGAAAGLLLQCVPGRAEPDADAWDRLTCLAATVQAEELTTLAPSTLLRRLFHEEDVRLYAGRPLSFGCSCSTERAEAAIRMIGRAEVEALLQERAGIEVTCEFCGRCHVLSPGQCRALFA